MTAPYDASRIAANWPPYLTARRAVAYSGRSRATINRAVAAGALPVHGRPGGGERIFRREDIDNWLASGLDSPAKTPPRPTVLRRSAGSTSTADALARIEAVGRGDRR